METQHDVVSLHLRLDLMEQSPVDSCLRILESRPGLCFPRVSLLCPGVGVYEVGAVGPKSTLAWFVAC